MFTFVTGGLRSGKSAYALRRASELGPPPWLYVGTSFDGDADIKQRLARSRRDQDAIWTIVEAPAHLGAALEAERLVGHGAVVVDGFSVWLSNRLSVGPKVSEGELLRDVEALADRMYRSTVPIVLVTTEIGLGFMPHALTDRGFLDVAGLANQVMAERAQTVVLMVSGVALRLR